MGDCHKQDGETPQGELPQTCHCVQASYSLLSHTTRSPSLALHSPATEISTTCCSSATGVVFFIHAAQQRHVWETTACRLSFAHPTAQLLVTGY